MLCDNCKIEITGTGLNLPINKYYHKCVVGVNLLCGNTTLIFKEDIAQKDIGDDFPIIPEFIDYNLNYNFCCRDCISEYVEKNYTNYCLNKVSTII